MNEMVALSWCRLFGCLAAYSFLKLAGQFRKILRIFLRQLRKKPPSKYTEQ